MEASGFVDYSFPTHWVKTHLGTSQTVVLSIFNYRGQGWCAQSKPTVCQGKRFCFEVSLKFRQAIYYTLYYITFCLNSKSLKKNVSTEHHSTLLSRIYTPARGSLPTFVLRLYKPAV